MSTLDREIQYVQNPAVGAALLGAFARSYQEEHPLRSGVPFPYLFVVLPILLHQTSLCFVLGTRSNLRGFAEKFLSSEGSSTDVLLGIAPRARRMRPQTLRAIRVLIESGMGTLNSEQGTVIAAEIVESLPAELMEDRVKAAKRLGSWFSQLTSFEIGSILKVTF